MLQGILMFYALLQFFDVDWLFGVRPRLPLHKQERPFANLIPLGAFRKTTPQREKSKKDGINSGFNGLEECSANRRPCGVRTPEVALTK